MMNKIKNFYQTHRYIWVSIIYFIVYLPWYFGIQLRNPAHFHDMHIALDQMIPFVPIFIYAYMYWFLFVGFTIIFIFLYDRDEFLKCCFFLYGGMTISLIIFTIYPTTFNYRPDVINGTLVERFFIQFVYTMDKPTNVFPSIHVFNSIGCAIILMKSKAFQYKKLVGTISITSALLITLSTMFVKQHSIMDALLAGIIAIILYYVVYVKFDRFLKNHPEKIPFK